MVLMLLTAFKSLTTLMMPPQKKRPDIRAFFVLAKC